MESRKGESRVASVGCRRSMNSVAARFTESISNCFSHSYPFPFFRTAWIELNNEDEARILLKWFENK